MKTLSLLFSLQFILFTVFLLDTANAQLNTENLFKAPFISAGNSQQSTQSIMQNSEKDIVFIENLGQIRDSKGKKRPDVLFLTRSQGVDMYIINSGITYVFRKTEDDIKDKDNVKDAKTSLYRLDMEFVGMNKNFNVKKELAVEQQFNYYTPEYPNGISPKGYKKITIENIYDDIDLVYYEKEGKMKYDFVVKAGADPDKIKMKYNGAGSVYIDKDGSVVVATPIGEIQEEKPYTYSSNTGIKIESGYKVKDNVVQFEIAEYNKIEDIIIDPYRIWATYYEGGGQDVGYSVCADNSGNIYVTGYTNSIDFPIQVLPGAYNQNTSGGSYDAFILKFNSSGVRLWATFYGGSSYDIGYGICIDKLGNPYITGITYSTDFPTKILTGAYNQNTSGGSYDAFILKFNSSGARIWATYYGGTNWDEGISICTDTLGNIYVTGRTSSTNFPIQTLLGAYNQISMVGPGGDAFILKFNSSSERLWATFYGGSGTEYGLSIYTDNSGNLYVTGHTSSTNFPTKTLTGAYNQTSYGGSSGYPGDAFILKFNSSGVRLWATYYGGNRKDDGNSICIDTSGSLYVTGSTGSYNFPTQTLPSAYNQTSHGGHLWDAFILKFNSNGVRIWATYYGGNGVDKGNSICIDTSGSLYVTGSTLGSNFPTQILQGAYNQTTNPIDTLYDAFILKFNSSCERQWATYYGGNGDDFGNSICTDSTANLYVTGSTWSPNFPIQILPGAYNDTTFGGGAGDAFILKFSPSPVGIKNISTEIPAKYSLYQNYPNPFNPTTNIRFEIPRTSLVKLTVYDILGREVATLVNDKLGAGSYEVVWPAPTGDASCIPSGVYFYKLTTNNFVDVKKMVLLK